MNISGETLLDLLKLAVWVGGIIYWTKYLEFKILSNRGRRIAHAIIISSAVLILIVNYASNFDDGLDVEPLKARPSMERFKDRLLRPDSTLKANWEEVSEIAKLMESAARTIQDSAFIALGKQDTASARVFAQEALDRAIGAADVDSVGASQSSYLLSVLSLLSDNDKDFEDYLEKSRRYNPIAAATVSLQVLTSAQDGNQSEVQQLLDELVDALGSDQVADDEREFQILWFMGSCEIVLGDFDSARKHLDQALEIKPGHIGVLHDRKKAYDSKE